MVGKINVSEDDFTTIASAAMDALNAGNGDDARKLDKIARKINAALSTSNGSRRILRQMGGKPLPVSWRDMPSVFDPLKTTP